MERFPICEIDLPYLEDDWKSTVSHIQTDQSDLLLSVIQKLELQTLF